MTKELFYIIPCYNEENRLPVDDYENFVTKTNHVCLLFVNDGSTDKTLHILNGLKQKFDDKILVLDLEKNVGKAEAIRQGYLSIENKGADCIAYLDADLATSLEEVTRLTSFLSLEIDFVFGSRVNRIGSNIKRKLSRHVIGRVIATYISSYILEIPVYDTQCGAKIFKNKIAKVAFSQPFVTNWLFDVEIFQRILRAHTSANINQYAKEVPLESWIDVENSKINSSQYFRILKDLLVLYRLKRK